MEGESSPQWAWACHSSFPFLHPAGVWGTQAHVSGEFFKPLGPGFEVQLALWDLALLTSSYGAGLAF